MQVSFTAMLFHFWVQQQTPPPASSTQQFRYNWHTSSSLGGTPFNVSENSNGLLSAANLTDLASDAANMFRYAFRGYMHHAFPKDELHPLSCRGKNSQGGIALTLLDSLDALVLFDDVEALRHAVRWVSHNASFDVDARVHVFEVTIRALGGLLSSHELVSRDPKLVPGYDGVLLRAAVDLADRLVPAFDTPTGLPTSWINLKTGHVRGDTRTTCTACAGTLLLEFGALSRMTGNGTYEALARHAVESLWGEFFFAGFERYVF
jgi:hypothetical protein